MRKTGRRLAVAALLLATAVATQAQCKFKRIATIPIEWHDDRLMVDGSINGTPLRMTVDTGAMQTVVSGALSDRLKLPAAHTNTFHVGFGGRSEVSVARLDEFSLGRFQWNRMKVSIIWQALRMPDVLVGAPLLFQRDVELTDKAIAYYSAEGCDGAPLGYWADDVPWLPMEPSPERDMRVFVMVKVNGVPVRALVDSGAPESLLDAAFARKLGLHPDDPALTVGGMGGIGEHVNALSVITLDSVAIGPEIVRKARIETVDMWSSVRADVRMSEMGDLMDDRESLILGADFIRAHHLLFATSQRRLYFTYLGGEVFRAHEPEPAASAPSAKAPAPAPAITRVGQSPS